MAISHVFSKTKKGVKCKPCDVGKLSFFSEADLDETGGAAHHKPLHRLYSYLRMAGARTLVREDALIPFGPMRDDDTALSKRVGRHVSSSEWVRLSFFGTEFSRYEDLRSMCDEDYLGYCILRKIRAGHDVVSSLHSLQIWEAVLRKTPVTNSYLHSARVYRGFVGTEREGREFRVRGSYYAQQDGATSICSHVALLTLLNDMRDPVDDLVRSHDINNRLADMERGRRVFGNLPNGKIGALSVKDCIDVLKGFGFRPSYRRVGTGSKWRYSEFLYPFLESGFPSMLDFEKPGCSDAPGHVVPVIGHSFNSDLWIPEATLGYGRLADDGAPILDSLQWTDHFLIHDDNYGMYMNLPVHCLEPAGCECADSDQTPCGPSARDQTKTATMERMRARIAIAVLPHGVLHEPDDAKERARELLCNLKEQLDTSSIWLAELLKALDSRVPADESGVEGARPPARAPVFRMLLLSKERLLDHWTSVDALKPGSSEWKQVDGEMPDRVWLVEASISEILTANRSKIVDFAIDATKHHPASAPPWDTCPVLRTPKRFLFPLRSWTRLPARSGDRYVPIYRDPSIPPPPER